VLLPLKESVIWPLPKDRTRRRWCSCVFRQSYLVFTTSEDRKDTHDYWGL